ncbi:helix-turn-helix transcriptional regulator [Streptomyces catenulae]|uniref:Helix-turn-helix domain-containing protein n=1 Tax=Streptomyces catenulae TaxID=66875 RepID=A0ABV2Z6R1_9ACTN|nr:helix-turn-helix domain-containing protein [Streptomyces catenulae]
MGYFTRDEDRTGLAAAQVARQCTASLSGLLAGLGMTRSDLAKAMGVSPGRVSQILSGDANLTVRTLAAAAQALDADVEIVFKPRPQSAQTLAQGAGATSLVGGSGSAARH